MFAWLSVVILVLLPACHSEAKPKNLTASQKQDPSLTLRKIKKDVWMTKERSLRKTKKDVWMTKKTQV